MKWKDFWWLAVLLCMVVIGTYAVQFDIQNSQSSGSSNRGSQQENVDTSLPAHMKVGEEKHFGFVQHDAGDDYEFGQVSSTGELTWPMEWKYIYMKYDDGSADQSAELHVIILKTDGDEATLKRLPDKNQTVQFVIYIPKNMPISGGRVQLGKNSFVQSQMIYQNTGK